ncbi:MAG: PBSX family phage terminase large subunit [Clostridia bacterium]|nr:PBSX family phage terminase large subunit [Clostridia bacterium]
MKITKKIASKYEDFIFDWNYETYLLFGGYGSGKSYHIAFKIILKLLEERRKALVVRQVFDTIQESCYDLFCEILDDMRLLTTDYTEYKRDRNKVYARKSPLSFTFHNGSKIIFKGMDKPEKAKSINNVSILWIEECTEIKFEAYEELLGRVRTPIASMHFILSCNPVGKENWVYSHFFRKLNDDGTEDVIMDEERLYEAGCLVRGDVYYLHSLPTDNNWLPRKYIKRLDDIRTYDPQLYNVARWGRFGATGTRVLPQFEIASNARKFREAIKALGDSNKYFGFDFGFEESYNAVVSMAVDIQNSILYIYDEIYVNHVTDDKMAELPQMQMLKDKLDAMAEAGHNNAVIIADNEDPKAIQYYRQCQFRIRACKNKFAGSRLSNTRKIKRFKHIIVSPKCKNVIRELKDLTYKKDRNGNVIYDEFNIDPHTFSAIWYALDTVTVADVKHDFNSKAG